MAAGDEETLFPYQISLTAALLGLKVRPFVVAILFLFGWLEHQLESHGIHLLSV
jgi:hypothetical protein